MQWIEFNFFTEHGQAELLTFMLSGLGAEGVTSVDREEFAEIFTEPLTDDVMVRDFLSDLSERVEVTAYFAAQVGELSDDLPVRINREMLYSEVIYDDVPKKWVRLGEFKQILTEQLQALPACELREIKAVIEEDWADNWKQYYEINHLTDRLVICPSWLEYTPSDQEVVIDLDPGSAFGTGTHETTALCLKFIDAFDLNNFSEVLDLGTGSGILAIAMAKLAKRAEVDLLIEAVDVDERATQVAIENCQKNQVEIDCYTATLDKTKREKYDLITANLVADIIVATASEFKRKLAKDGRLLVSGIIDSKRRQVIDRLTEVGFVLEEEESAKDWYAMIFKHGQDNQIK